MIKDEHGETCLGNPKQLSLPARLHWSFTDTGTPCKGPFKVPLIFYIRTEYLLKDQKLIPDS